MRVIVTGSRRYRGPDVWRVLDELLAEHGELTVVHGQCASGADAAADHWVRSQQRRGAPVQVERFPADWKRLGDAAGPARNVVMVAAGADLCIAFHMPPPAKNKGTKGCVRLARAAGIEVREYGRVTHATVEQEARETPDYEQETLPI